jgi:predicted N-acetyltransferase YhbS
MLDEGRYLRCSYREFRDGDEVAIEELLKNVFPRFKENNLWFWKYKLNPSFDPLLLVVAEKDGEIVGCNYWLLRDLKLSSNTQVKAALGADVAVHPDYRGQGIGTELIRFPRLSGAFKEKEILVSYMFGRPELTKRFYSPAAGYVIAPNGTITYRKLFNCRELKAKFQEIDEAIKSNDAMKKQLKELVMCISFRLRGAPEFAVYIEQETVYLEEGKAKNPDVVIEGNLPLSSSIINGTGHLVKAWLTGKFKVRKGLMKIFRMRKAFKVFRMALDQKS